MTETPPVSWTELVRIRAEANAQLAAARAEWRASLAEGHRAHAWWVEERAKVHQTKDDAILAALRTGHTVRAICRDLKTGPNRVCRLRALLVRTTATDTTTDTTTCPPAS